MSDAWGRVYQNGEVVCGGCERPAKVYFQRGNIHVTCLSLQCPNEGKVVPLHSSDEASALCPDCQIGMDETATVDGLWSCKMCKGLWAYIDGEFVKAAVEE